MEREGEMEGVGKEGKEREMEGVGKEGKEREGYVQKVGERR